MRNIVFVVLCAIGLAGCSSEYIINTSSGELITTGTKPKLDDDTGMYIFEDSSGRKQAIPAADVKQIMER